MAQITTVLNEEKYGIEIRFPKDTPENRKFAESFAPIGKPETQAEAEARSVNDYIAAQEAAYWDKFTM